VAPTRIIAGKFIAKGRMATASTNVRADDLLASYAALGQTLMPGLGGLCLFDEALALWEATPGADPHTAAKIFKAPQWEAARTTHTPVAASTRSGALTVAIPMMRSSGRLLGVLCAQFPPSEAGRHGDRPATTVADRLKPALDCLQRELAARRSRSTRASTAAERTAELEWLFDFSTEAKTPGSEQHALERLLAASAARLECKFAALIIPDKRIAMEHVADDPTAAALREVLTQMQAHLLTWAHRRERPLVSNGVANPRAGIRPCKIISVPVASKSGRIIGVLVFLNPSTATDFRSRHAFLARHLGRHVTTLLEAQFDLMTDLLTRAALEERFSEIESAAADQARSLVFVDIDRLHVVNELHGFELGDEIIARVAQLLGPPILPEDSPVARVGGDCFAIVLSNCDPQSAAEVAKRLQTATSQIRIGPSQEPVEVSVSCGIAALVSMPKGFARALAAAEIACKAAKDRGRARIELYACEDASMMRRHDDVLIVGQLRDALKSDRLALYAQKIVPLRDREKRGGYEVLVRLQTADGSISAPSEFLSAAQRYQLLPSLDRWVVARALRTLSAYRSTVTQAGVSFSMNVSAQSIGDEAFIEQLIDQIRSSGVPPSALTIEITEQSAVSNLATAAELMRRMRRIGCQVALDDFGTGMNSLASLKGLPISRIKIDGSFVKDLLTNARSLATVQAVLALARPLELDTVAEYVETEAVASRLALLGIDYGQGFAFGKPEPLEDVLIQLQTEESRRLRALALEV
jgi:diguanylate cyclase (GGDEF)-like protein